MNYYRELKVLRPEGASSKQAFGSAASPPDLWKGWSAFPQDERSDVGNKEFAASNRTRQLSHKILSPDKKRPRPRHG